MKASEVDGVGAVIDEIDPLAEELAVAPSMPGRILTGRVWFGSDYLHGSFTSRQIGALRRLR